MTIKEYNDHFYQICAKAASFVSCIDHALQKSDDNARMQMKVIGWDEDTKLFLLEAIERMKAQAKDSYMWSTAEWWEKRSM